MYNINRRRIFVVLLISAAATLFVAVLFQSLRSNYIEGVFNRYGQVKIGMQKDEVIRVLGRPRMIKKIKRADMEQVVPISNAQKEIIDKIKTQDGWLTKYTYWITNLPRLWGRSEHVGINIFIEEKSHTVVFISRLNE